MYHSRWTTIWSVDHHPSTCPRVIKPSFEKHIITIKPQACYIKATPQNKILNVQLNKIIALGYEKSVVKEWVHGGTTLTRQFQWMLWREQFLSTNDLWLFSWQRSSGLIDHFFPRDTLKSTCLGTYMSFNWILLCNIVSLVKGLGHRSPVVHSC